MSGALQSLSTSMTSTPSHPKIYHITHIDNLASIASSNYLMSDAKRIAMSKQCSLVGMSKIKQRRLEEIEVSCPRHESRSVRTLLFLP